MKLLASSTIGVQLFQSMALIGTLWGIYSYDIDITTFYLVLLGYFLYGCLGIVVTFHRQLTHESFNANPLIIKLFSILGCFSVTGSPLAWVAIHINHHLRSDKPNDPHSPLYRGLKIFNLDYVNEIANDTKWRMRRLVTDRFQQFLHRYYFGIILFYSLALFLIGGIYLMIFLHWAPALITAIMSNVVNYIGHSPNYVGSFKSYKLNDQSVNNWIFAIPSWGETWHNNHHRFPKNYRCGQTWWQIDIAAYIIRLIKVI
jgi:stearoyl-CoA desaturase (delta-9 desaturase)